MAAVIDDPSYSYPIRTHHSMIATPTTVHNHHDQQQQQSQQRDSLRSTAPASQQPHQPYSTTPSTCTVADIQAQSRPFAAAAQFEQGQYQQRQHHDPAAAASNNNSADRGASRIPSPPISSPAVSVGTKSATDDAPSVSMASQNPSVENQAINHAIASSSHPSSHNQQPSPPNDDFQIPHDASQMAPPANPPQPLPQTVVHIRDLAHIQSLAKADLLSRQGGAAAGSGSGILNEQPQQHTKYEISAMPIGDVIEMVAALLTKITTTNDLQHDAMQRNAVHQQQAGQSGESSGSSQMSPLSHSVLAFHGKNVPGITILSYLSRIHKYCPTTYEVFLSLLVYFDRMTERVNDMVTRNEQTRRSATTQSVTTSRPASRHTQTTDTRMTDKSESAADSDEVDSDLADDDDDSEDDDDDDDDEMADSSGAPSRVGSSKGTTAPVAPPAIGGPATYFVVDSFNIHRLVIAGVTCASKFFSDVFYTNSRYAKVGGLPLAELNHLELQFLLLNDFRLAVPVEILEAYGTMLVEFYARDVAAGKVGARPA